MEIGISGAKRTALLTGLATLLVAAPVGYVVGRAGGPPPPPPPREGPAPMDHAGMDHRGMAPMGGPATGAPTGPFTDANARMHSAMNVAPTGDVDLDFAQGMIPHHEGAVEMARIELRQGKDPEMRKLAETVVRTQGVEIAAMRAWIAKRGTK